MQATALTLATGATIEVKGTYEDITLTLSPRTLSQDTGMREFVKTDGGKIKVAVGAVAVIEEIGETKTSGCKLGFVK